MFERIHRSNVLKLSLLTATTAACILLAVVFNIYYKIDIVYTHLFYIPIVMAGIWYRRKSLFVAALLGMVHIFADFVITQQITGRSLLRTLMFLTVALVVGNLSAKNHFMYRKLKNLNSAMLDIVAEVSTEGIIEYVSPSCEKLLGYTTYELVGKSFFELVIEKERQRLKEAFEDAVTSDSSIRFDYMCIKKDGSHIWIESIANPVFEGSKHLQVYVFGSRDISTQKEAEEELQFLSLHDPMTKLYNRAYFEDTLKRFSSGRFDPIGIVVADIDGLKTINDTFGHDVGDRLIIAAGELLSSKFRASDITARIGGDEFVVFLPNCSQEAWEQIIERVADNNESPPIIKDGIPLLLSMGYAFRIDSDRSLDELFKDADTMMYKQKAANKARSQEMLKKAITQTNPENGSLR